MTGIEPTFLFASRLPLRVGDDVLAGEVFYSAWVGGGKKSFPLLLFMPVFAPYKPTIGSGKCQKNDASKHHYGGTESCPYRSLIEPE